MHDHRGRSRNVSPVAVARQASEERRRSLLPPPQSLEDQIQVAYALDNIRLAKILLLKLKRVHVTDDSDPRIDQVRDEDFDVCFTPSGPLTLDDDDKRAIQETRRRQTQWWHESQRAQRLRACERLWEDEKNRLHQDKLCALQRRELAHEQERARRDPQRHHAPSPLDVPSTPRDSEPFQYAFMHPPKLSPPKSLKKASPGRQHRSVSFKDVINAMNGQLFPLDGSERAEDARRIAGLSIQGTTPHRRKVSVRAELLDNLLQVVEWQDGERRKAKGKQVDHDPHFVKSQPPALTPVPSVPSSLSVTSMSSSASSSRSGSWLTFGSWRSTATDITAPDSPVPGSPSCSPPCQLPTLVDTQRETHPHCAFVRISLEESPLCPPLPPQRRSLALEDDGPCATPYSSPTELVPSLSMRGVLVKRVTRSVATIVEVAKGLQSAYLTATMFTAGSPYADAVAPSQPRSPILQSLARREGYRALAKDVQKFTYSATPISQQPSEPVHFIPLVSQPSTALSKPLAPKNVIVIPSPLRPREPPTALAYRMRPIANPAVLRLKALQNLMCARGKEWEGRAREGGLGCGKERMLGVAFEGRGRSGLGCEVRFVVA